MLTNSYVDWMRRPLSSAVCPTPDIWPDTSADTLPDAQPDKKPDTPPDKRPYVRPGTALQPISSREEFMNEEKLRILKMLEDGKVTAAEAARLMEALDKSDSRPKESDIKRKWLHIRVQEHGRDTVNMKVPLALLKFGFKLAPHAARHHAMSASRTAERARDRAERARERAQREREKAARGAQRAAERMKRKLSGELGEHPGLNIDELVNQAVRESMEEMEQAVAEGVREAEEALAEHTRNGLGGVFAGKDFDLDLDKILEMAQSEGFDGRIIDIHDEEDDEHVTITLE